MAQSPEWVFSDKSWTPLRAPELTAPPSDALPSLGFARCAELLCWQAWYKESGDCVYKRCVVLKVAPVYEVVWFLDTPNFMDWMAAYGAVPVLV